MELESHAVPQSWRLVPTGILPFPNISVPCCVPANAAERAQCGPVCWAGPFHLGDVGRGTHSRESHTDGIRPGESWHLPPGPQPVPFLVSPPDTRAIVPRCPLC